MRILILLFFCVQLNAQTINVLRPAEDAAIGLQLMCPTCGDSFLKYNAVEVVIVGISPFGFDCSDATFDQIDVRADWDYNGNDISGSVDLDIDWGDGNTQTLTNAVNSTTISINNLTHNYLKSVNNAWAVFSFTSDSGLDYEFKILFILDNACNPLYEIYNPILGVTASEANCQYLLEQQFIIEDQNPIANYRKNDDWSTSYGDSGNQTLFLSNTSNPFFFINANQAATGNIETITEDIDIENVFTGFPPPAPTFYRNVVLSYDILNVCL